MIRVFMVGMSTDKGGVESYIGNLCEHLDDKEFEIVYAWSKMNIDGQVWIAPRNRHNYIRYARFWNRFFKKNRFDVIYFNTCDIVSIDLLRFAKKSGIPVRIIHSHSTAVQFKMRWFHRITEKYNRRQIANIATVLLACSEEAGKWMFGTNNFVVVKNGIYVPKYIFNEQFRDEYRRKLGVADEVLIGCVGRLDPEKNPLMSVDIMECINKKNPNSRFVFIGDGELKESVQASIKAKDMLEKIILLGACDDVYKWYSALDCLLMPSLFEGVPFALIEAQTSGLPCVVSSSVSRKADITGLIKYVDLNESVDNWAKLILEECKKQRKSMTRQICNSGYSIIDTVRQVEKVLKKSL